MERKDRDVKASHATYSFHRAGPLLASRGIGGARPAPRSIAEAPRFDERSVHSSGAVRDAPTHTHTHTYSSAAEGRIRHVPRPKFRPVLLASLPRPFFRSVNVLLTPVFGGVRADVLLCGWWPLGETDSSAVVLG